MNSDFLPVNIHLPVNFHFIFLCWRSRTSVSTSLQNEHSLAYLVCHKQTNNTVCSATQVRRLNFMTILKQLTIDLSLWSYELTLKLLVQFVLV